jgi:tetratricopeptide (TPR) repeat protein
MIARKNFRTIPFNEREEEGETMRHALVVLLSLTCAVPAFAADSGAAPDARSRAAALVEQGNGLLKSDQYEEAKKAFQDAAVQDPTYAEAYGGLGKVSMLQLKYDEAAGEYSKALSLSPDDGTVLFNRAVAYSHLGKWSDVVQDLTEVLRLYPKNSAAHNLRGIAHFEQGQFDEAVSDYSKAIELNPGYSKAYNNRALAYQRLGKTAEAARDFAKSGEPKSGPTATPGYKCAF